MRVNKYKKRIIEQVVRQLWNVQIKASKTCLRRRLRSFASLLALRSISVESWRRWLLLLLLLFIASSPSIWLVEYATLDSGVCCTWTLWLVPALGPGNSTSRMSGLCWWWWWRLLGALASSRRVERGDLPSVSSPNVALLVHDDSTSLSVSSSSELISESDAPDIRLVSKPNTVNLLSAVGISSDLFLCPDASSFCVRSPSSSDWSERGTGRGDDDKEVVVDEGVDEGRKKAMKKSAWLKWGWWGYT